MSKKQYKIIKLPNNNKHPIEYYDFKHVPQQYFELIENKSKVKQDLINTDFSISDEMLQSLRNISKELPSTISSYEDTYMSDSDEHSDIEMEYKQSDEENDSNVFSDMEEDEIPMDINTEQSIETNIIPPPSENHILTEKDKLESLFSNKNKRQEIHSNPTKSTTFVSPKIFKQIPTLSQLEKDGKIKPNNELPNVERLSSFNDTNIDLKRELLFKYEILKKTYKNIPNDINIPQFTINSDYNTMLDTYNNLIKHLSLDSNVEKYKKYLIFGCMLVEYVLGSFFKLDMKGFTQYQINEMSSYEKLLYELGEKTYLPKSNLPVELRLLILILFNAAIFVVNKLITNSLGFNITSMFSSLNQNTPSKSQSSKRSMKGPDINLDEFPDNH